MPPTRALRDELIAIFEAWVLGGMPETAAEAAALSAPPAPQATLPPYPYPYPLPVAPQTLTTPTPYP